ncbi:hypothetical protein BCR39DRAFT_506377 [Naematelia encephala]|uniref:Uncharacterized protein n=1 Tax=Naematelia encephala TaxID=71784 RepID=A0A1Y2AWX5_9TREE|nr:hypothetical protein BCR39DRAFT_506377 [Naematelia encephala]
MEPHPDLGPMHPDRKRQMHMSNSDFDVSVWRREVATVRALGGESEQRSRTPPFWSPSSPSGSWQPSTSSSAYSGLPSIHGQPSLSSETRLPPRFRSRRQGFQPGTMTTRGRLAGGHNESNNRGQQSSGPPIVGTSNRLSGTSYENANGFYDPQPSFLEDNRSYPRRRTGYPPHEPFQAHPQMGQSQHQYRDESRYLDDSLLNDYDPRYEGSDSDNGGSSGYPDEDGCWSDQVIDGEEGNGYGAIYIGGEDYGYYNDQDVYGVYRGEDDHDNDGEGDTWDQETMQMLHHSAYPAHSIAGPAPVMGSTPPFPWPSQSFDPGVNPQSFGDSRSGLPRGFSGRVIRGGGAYRSSRGR